MADLDKIQNSVFGGVQFNENKNEGENTSFFENNNNSNANNTNNKDNTKNQNWNANNVFGTFGTSNNGTNNETTTTTTTTNNTIFKPIGQDSAIAKQTLWSKIKAFLFQEIDLNAPIRIELTPYQQKVENEINEFLHQEVSFKGIANFFKWKK